MIGFLETIDQLKAEHKEGVCSWEFNHLKLVKLV